jgi:LAO/AO transport system kinase
VVELADLVVINKADIDASAATRAEAQITSALRLLGMHGHPDHAHFDEEIWHPEVIQISALLNQGVDSFWHRVLKFKRLQQAKQKLEQRRQAQKVISGQVPASTAARQLLAAYQATGFPKH